jgi:hypothetical protein
LLKDPRNMTPRILFIYLFLFHIVRHAIVHTWRLQYLWHHTQLTIEWDCSPNVAAISFQYVLIFKQLQTSTFHSVHSPLIPSHIKAINAAHYRVGVDLTKYNQHHSTYY